jgi:hypothetical protein
MIWHAPHTNAELLNIAKAATGLQSDYALAQRLGITRSAVSAQRLGKRIMEDGAAVKLAGLAELPLPYVLACLHHQRASDPGLKAAWHSMASTAIQEAA